MATYTYLACDLLTGAILAELPLSDVSFSSVLSGAGEFSSTLSISDQRVQKIDPITATEPGRTALYVDRDGVLVWGGILWVRRYNPRTEQLTLSGNEFWSYLRRRYITDDKVFTATDQLTIAQNLVNYAQSKPGGNIGVVVGSNTSGVLRDFAAYGYERKQVAEAVEELSDLDNSFDFAVDLAYDVSMQPTKTLNFSYPRRGRTAPDSGFVFEFPGNTILEPSWDEDGAKMSNTLYGQGQGEGEDMVRSVIATPTMLDAGYPLLEDVVSAKDVGSQGVLDDRIRAIAEARVKPVTLPKLTVRANAEPVLGSYITGDDVHVSITSKRFPNGIETTRRILEISVTPADTGQYETVDLTLGEAG